MVNRKIIFWIVAILVLTLYNLTPALNSFDTEYYILAGQNFLDCKIDSLIIIIKFICCINKSIFFPNGVEILSDIAEIKEANAGLHFILKLNTKYKDNE